jgi:tetratricopeptide (TPR) repeat protein
VVVGLAGTLTQAHRAERERDMAMRQLRSAEASREFVGFLLSDGGGGKPVSPSVLERGARLIDQEFASDPEQRASLQSLLAQLYNQSRAPGEAHALLLRAKENADRAANLDLQMQIQCQLALHADAGEQAQASARLLDAAIDTLRQASDVDPATLTGCLHIRGERVRMNGGNLAQGVADAQEALARMGSPRPDQQVETVGIRTTLASLQAKAGQSAAAATQFRQALDQLDAIGWGRTEMAVRLNNNLGQLLFLAGQPRDAILAFKHSTDISHEAGVAIPTIDANYARVLSDVGRPQDAIRFADSAVQALSPEIGPANEARVKIYAARAWCGVRDATRCEQLLKEARAALAQVAPEPTVVLAQIEMGLAELAGLRGETAVARDRLKRAIEYFDVDREPHRDRMRALALLARQDLAAADFEAARLHAERSVQLARDRMDGFEHSAWLGWALLSQGLVQQRLGDGRAARATWQQALVELGATVGAEAPEARETRRLLTGGDVAAGY